MRCVCQRSPGMLGPSPSAPTYRAVPYSEPTTSEPQLPTTTSNDDDAPRTSTDANDRAHPPTANAHPPLLTPHSETNNISTGAPELLRMGGVCQVCLTDNVRCSCQRWTIPERRAEAPTGGNRRANPYTQSRLSDGGGLQQDNSESVIRQGIQTLSIADPFADPSNTDLLGELLEQEVLAHFDYVQATQQTRVRTSSIQPTKILSDWVSLRDGLQALAYEPGAACPWNRLGVGKNEGPSPSLDQIERRVRFAVLLASASQQPSWSQSDRDAAEQFQQEVEAARKDCIDQLGDVLKSRRKVKGWQLPRWQEPSLDLLQYMVEQVQAAGDAWRIALHMSNLQGISFENSPQTLPPAEARLVLGGLCKGPSTGVQVLSRFDAGGVVTWAPQESDALHRLVAAYKEYATSASSTAGCQLVLLIPHDPYPECSSPSQILDLWWHPILGDKFSSLVKRVQFLRQPTCCVFSTETSPIYHNKALVMVTLALHLAVEPPLLSQWRPTLATVGDEITVVVDCLAETAVKTQRALRGATVSGLIRWEGPVRSLGSQGTHRRVTFRGYLSRAATTPLEVQLCILSLRRKPDLKNVMIGSQALFSDSSALLADIRHPATASRIADLCTQLAFVSPRLVLLHTSLPKEVWELSLTELVREDAEKAVERIRWRRSSHDRVWAKPLALDAQVRAAQARARPRQNNSIENDPELSSMIVIRGILGADPGRLITELMTSIASRTHLRLCRGESESSLRSGQWRQLVDGAGQCTGSVRIVLATAAEVQTLVTEINASSIQVNGHIQYVEVHNSMLVPPVPSPTEFSQPTPSMAGYALQLPGNANGSPGMQAAPLPAAAGLAR